MSTRSAMLLALALWLVALFVVPALDRSTALDIGVYWEAAARWRDGLSAYQEGIHLQFKYSPFCTWLFSRVFSESPVTDVYGAYRAGSLAVWIALFFPALRLAPIAALALFAIAAPSIAEETKLGQVNFVVATLGMGAAYLLAKRPTSAPRARGSECMAGAMLAIAIGFKLFVALWIPVLLARREYRALAWSLVWMLALNLIPPMWTIGAERALLENRLWLTHLWVSSADLLSSRYNASLIGVALKLGLPSGAVKAAWLMLCLSWLAVIVRYRGRLMENIWVGVALTGLAIVILNPLVWSYWVWLALPSLWLLRGQRSPLVWGALGLFWAAGWSHHSTYARDGGLVAGAILALFALGKSLDGQSPAQRIKS